MWDASATLWARIRGIFDLRELAVLRGHGVRVDSVSFSPSADRIVTGSDDKTVRIWDAQIGQELAVLRGHRGGVNSVVFSSDGDRIVSGADDNTVRIWDARSGKQLAELSGHRGDVNCVAFSPCGDRVASASDDGTVRVWDPQVRDTANMLRGHGSFREVACSPHGHRIVSASGDTVRLWSGKSGEELAVFHHPYEVTKVVFSPDGDRVACGIKKDHYYKDYCGIEQFRADVSVRVWCALSCKELGEFHSTEHWRFLDNFGVSFSPDGNRIAIKRWRTEWCGTEEWDAPRVNVVKANQEITDPQATAPTPTESPLGASTLLRFLVQETVIEESGTGQAIAWFPERVISYDWTPLRDGTWHFNSRILAGRDQHRSHLYILRLEGDPSRRAVPMADQGLSSWIPVQ